MKKKRLMYNTQANAIISNELGKKKLVKYTHDLTLVMEAVDELEIEFISMKRVNKKPGQPPAYYFKIKPPNPRSTKLLGTGFSDTRARAGAMALATYILQLRQEGPPKHSELFVNDDNRGNFLATEDNRGNC